MGWLYQGRFAATTAPHSRLCLPGEVVAVESGTCVWEIRFMVLRSPVYRGLCRVCFGFRSDGLKEANLTTPY
jgi:hypothetical protein